LAATVNVIVAALLPDVADAVTHAGKPVADQAHPPEAPNATLYVPPATGTARLDGVTVNQQDGWTGCEAFTIGRTRMRWLYGSAI
jgi:hypothetical protein